MADEKATMLPSSQASTSNLPEDHEPITEDTITVLPKEDVPSSSRPTRSTRYVRPVRYCDSDDELVEEQEASSQNSKARVPAKRSNEDSATNGAAKQPPAKRARPTPRSKKSKWDRKYVTENEKSPLVKVDLRSLLLQPAAWDCLTAEDKKEVLDLFPDKHHILCVGTSDARPDLQSLRNDDNFRHDCDQYVANLSNGMHDPTWLKDAWIAHERRNAGQFDEFHIRKLELDWSATIPDQYKPANLRPQQNDDPSTTAPVSANQDTNDKTVESKGKSDNFTSQRFAVNADTKKKAKGKKGGAATGPSRKGKGSKAAEPLPMYGANDSTNGGAVDEGKAPAVGNDAETKPTSTIDVKNEEENSVIEAAGDRSSDGNTEKPATAAKQNDAVDSEVKPKIGDGASTKSEPMDTDADTTQE